jgi:hypothetical protein
MEKATVLKYAARNSAPAAARKAPRS